MGNQQDGLVGMRREHSVQKHMCICPVVRGIMACSRDLSKTNEVETGSHVVCSNSGRLGQNQMICFRHIRDLILLENYRKLLGTLSKSICDQVYVLKRILYCIEMNLQESKNGCEKPTQKTTVKIETKMDHSILPYSLILSFSGFQHCAWITQYKIYE